MTPEDLMRLIPIEARRDTADRGGFPRGRCADGLCVLSALIHDLDYEYWWGDKFQAKPMPFVDQVILALIDLGVVPACEHDPRAYSEAFGAIAEIIYRNDTRKLSRRNAARRLLLPEEGA